MARFRLVFLLPILLSLSLSLLADATWNPFLPLHKHENNEKDDYVKKNYLLRLPSESANEMMTEVPKLVRTPWITVRGPAETHIRFSEFPGLREAKRERVSIEGIKGLRFGRRGGCHLQHGRGKLKFRPQGDRIRPQFPRSFFFPSSGESHLHGKYDDGAAASFSYRSFPMVLPQTGNEESGFEPREAAFKQIGKGFPERKHSHSKWEWAFPNQKEDEEKEHQKRHGPAAPWTDWLRSLLPRP